jgi:hypothetical protein
MGKPLRNAPKWIWYMLFGVLLWLSFNRNWRFGRFNYHDELWADKAGYHVFLPASVIYGWDARLFPNEVDALSGGGFQLDGWRNAINTKYPPGVAVMRLPFFLAAHAWALLSGQPADGFSMPYHAAAIAAGVFYAVAGLWVCWRFLLYYFRRSVAWVGVAGMIAGTNLWYYVVEEPGLSHGYSFFLVALLLWELKRFSLSEQNRHLALAGLCACMIFCVRPQNLILLSPYLLWWLWQHGAAIIKKPVAFAWAASCFILAISPFVAYRIYLHAKGFIPYGSEGFIYWKSPHLLKVLFAPENGFFPCSPFFLPFIPMAIWYSYKNTGAWRFISASALLVFTSCALLYACWWAWGLACGFGHRGFIEFYPLMAWVMLRGIADVWHHFRWRLATTVFLITCALLVLPLSFHWPYCLEGPFWNWHRYISIWLGTMV